MKRLILKLSFFFVVGYATMFFFSWFDNKNAHSTTNLNIQRLQNIDLFDSLDILFMGNSYCYSGVNPKYMDSLGLHTYNLGIATAGPFFYDYVINDYLSNNVSPGKIMLLVSPTTFSIKADNFIDYPIHRYLKQPKSNEKVVLDFGSYKDYFLLLFNSSVKGIRYCLLPEKKNVKRDISTRGFFGSEDVFSAEVLKRDRYLYNSLVNERFDKKKGSHLLAMANSLRAKGIEVIFFEVPTNLLNDFYNQKFLDEYNEYCTILRDADFLVLKNDIDLDASYFRNIDHLNSKGAAVVTKNIITRLSGLAVAKSDSSVSISSASH